MDESEALRESKIAEAANAAAVAVEAQHKANEASFHETMVSALQEVLTAGERDNVPLLIRRIPFLCASVTKIQEDQDSLAKTQEKILGDLKWFRYLGGGFLIAAGLLAMKALGIG